MSIEVENVKLLKTDTCLTYALKRIGMEVDPDTVNFDNIHDHFDSIVYTDKKVLQVGDMFFWTRDSKYIDLPWEIDKNGRITWHRQMVGAHIAVYEGDGIISDCTRTIQSPHPTLRLRKLSQLNKMPDYILRDNGN